MDLNNDPSVRVSIETTTVNWVASPAPGVVRKMLQRQGDEPARATAGSYLPMQERPGGEEVFVLHGAFTDDHGRYGARCWLRMPEGARYTPSSVEGGTFLSKTGHLGLSSRPPGGAH